MNFEHIFTNISSSTRVIKKSIIIIIIYHDFLRTPRRGSHVKSDITHTHTHTHTVIKIHPLTHILDS